LKLLELAALLKPNYVEDWYHVLLSELPSAAPAVIPTSQLADQFASAQARLS
jgi:hypothetical protein